MKSRIDSSLLPIYEYLRDKVHKRLDVANLKLEQEAADYSELRHKQLMIKLRGTNQDVDNGEELEGVEEIIKSLSKRRRDEDDESDNEDDEIPETALQIQLKELTQRYNIYIDRQKVQQYNQRGVIKCEAEPKAFYEYKRNSLFQKKDELIMEDNQLERKALV